jgi:transcriptional regulator with XRE-family HTH domain
MTPEERRRAGGAVAERMKELGLTAPRLAEKARVDPTTVRALITGTRWPRDDTRERITAALDWPPEEISRRVLAGRVPLDDVATADLIRELCRRFDEDHPHVR